jgi:hypothetical protein
MFSNLHQGRDKGKHVCVCVSYYYNTYNNYYGYTLNIYYYLSWKYVNKHAFNNMRLCQYPTIVVTIARSTIYSKYRNKRFFQVFPSVGKNVGFIFSNVVNILLNLFKLLLLLLLLLLLWLISDDEKCCPFLCYTEKIII